MTYSSLVCPEDIRTKSTCPRDVLCNVCILRISYSTCTGCRAAALRNQGYKTAPGHQLCTRRIGGLPAPITRQITTQIAPPRTGRARYQQRPEPHPAPLHHMRAHIYPPARCGAGAAPDLRAAAASGCVCRAQCTTCGMAEEICVMFRSIVYRAYVNDNNNKQSVRCKSAALRMCA